MVADLIRHSVKVSMNSGIYRLIQKSLCFIYRGIWPRLNQTNKIVNPYYLLLLMKYEYQYVSMIQKYINKNEFVVVIGGGDGVSAVAASNQVQPHGKVQVFEGGREEVKKTQRMIDVNNFSQIAMVNHTIVSNDYSLRSSANGAEIISPSDLPECDTLAIDADGAEFEILKNLENKPQKIIIEHHIVPKKQKNPDVSNIEIEYEPDKIRSEMQNLGYEIIEEVSEPDRAYGRFEERIFVAELE